MLARVTLVALGLLTQTVHSLLVTPSSPCYDTCDGGSGTSTGDMVCSDGDYESTNQGRKMRGCLNCLQNSTTYEGEHHNDVYWFLYNMKYTLQTCIFTHQTNPALASCNSSCSPIEPVLTTSWWGDERPAQYEYCSQNKSTFVGYSGGCASCLEDQTNTKVLGNFLQAMLSACSDKPNATEKETVSLSSALFPAKLSASASASSAANTNNDSKSGLSTGAKAGIGVGVGVGAVAIIGLVGFLLCCRRRRKANAPAEMEASEAPAYTPSYEQDPQKEGTVQEQSPFIAELGSQAQVLEMGSHEPVAAELPADNHVQK